MSSTATLQVEMDKDLKEQVEQLYENMGTSFAEAVRIFAKQSVLESGMPFSVSYPVTDTSNRIGIAKGEFVAPDDIDFCNKEIAQMFGVE